MNSQQINFYQGLEIWGQVMLPPTMYKAKMYRKQQRYCILPALVAHFHALAHKKIRTVSMLDRLLQGSHILSDLEAWDIFSNLKTSKYEKGSRLPNWLPGPAKPSNAVDKYEKCVSNGDSNHFSHSRIIG